MDSFKIFIEGAQEYRPEIFEYLKKQPDDVLVHFTNHHRVGIKMKPSHQDPIGIYAFPKQYVMSSAFNKNSHFFGMKNVFILKLKPGAKTLNLSRLTETEVDHMLHKMGISEYKGKENIRDRKEGKPGHVLWDTIEKYLNDHFGYGKKNVEWLKLFKKAGNYDALIDEGDAIIHQNEPAQVVILNPTAYIEISKFSSTAQEMFKRLAYRIMNELGQMLFDKFQIFTKNQQYNDKNVTARGIKNGKPLSLSLTYYANEDQDRLRSGLRGKLILSSSLTKEYDVEEISIPVDSSEYDLRAELHKIAEKFSKFSGEQNYRQSMQPYVQELMKQVLARLGLGRAPKVDGEQATYKKTYPQYGTLLINCWYSNYDQSFHLSMLLKNERSRFYPYTLYGKQDNSIPADEAMADIPKAARTLVRENLYYWEGSIQKYYNPDYEKHNAYDKHSGRAFTLARVGETLEQFMNLLRRNIATRGQALV